MRSSRRPRTSGYRWRMSDDIPRDMRPIRPKDNPGGEIVALSAFGAVAIVVGIIITVIGLNVTGDFLDGFLIEDLAQKIAVTIVGVAVGIVGFISLIAAIMLTGLRSAVIRNI